MPNDRHKIAADYWAKLKQDLARRDAENRRIDKLTAGFKGWRIVPKQPKSLPGQRGMYE